MPRRATNSTLQKKSSRAGRVSRSSTFAVKAFGCRSNQFDAEALAHLLTGAHYRRVHDFQDAAICILVGCSVTHRADRDLRRAVRQARRANPRMKIVLAGCSAQLPPPEGVDQVVPRGTRGQIVENIGGRGEDREDSTIFFQPVLHHSGRTRVLVKIQEGCNNRCAYCIVPLLRGAARSLPGERVIEHCRRLLDAGVEHVYISFKEAEAWNRYLEDQLRDRISDPGRPLEERAKILLDTAAPLMREVLDNPASPGVKERVGNLADAIVDLIDGPEAFATAVQVMGHDYYTYTHCTHVSIYLVALAREIGIDAPDLLRSLGRAGLMHDCGKCRIPRELINKPGRFTATEWEAMKRHPVEGVRILEEAGWDDEIVREVFLQNHAMTLTHPYHAMVTAGVAMLITWSFSVYETRIGKRENSPAIIADGKHIRTDAIVSFIVLLGLIGRRFQFLSNKS